MVPASDSAVGTTVLLRGEESRMTGVRMLMDLRTPMRDGVELSSDLWLPDDEDPHPVILFRTPYIKAPSGLAEFGRFFAEHEYVVAIQDVRGRGDSDGDFAFLSNEGRDGYDTIEWMATRPWCDGRVGTAGGSYLGTVQWLAARERPPHLACMAPAAALNLFPDELPYLGGAFLGGWALNWANLTSARSLQGANTSGHTLDEVWRHRPLSTLDAKFGRVMPLYQEFLAHELPGPYWDRIRLAPSDFAAIDLPTLMVTGWFDENQLGTFHFWEGMRRHSRAREHQYLVVGPWTHETVAHGGEQGRTLGDFDFGAESVFDVRELHLEFFNRYLRDSTEPFAAPRARLFVSGTNVWQQGGDVSVRVGEEASLYLTSHGDAATVGGALVTEPPVDGSVDGYSYDPTDPIIGIRREDRGTDQTTYERRPDVLVYTSHQLESPLTVLGNLKLELYASSDALDTDFIARILDVDLRGRALALGAWPFGGIIRARYRQRRDVAGLLTPGEVERYLIDLHWLGHTFLAGHRVRLEITSSHAPLVTPNSNTGNPLSSDTEYRVAHQKIHQSPEARSRLMLPILG